jgi:glycosyltransferase involved in cell wall biosynthesis
LRHQLFVRAETFACQNVNIVCSVSKADLADLQNKISLQHTAHVPNAIDLGQSHSRQLARQKLNLPADVFVVGTVARLVPQKAVDDLLTGFVQADLQRKAHLVIVGEGYLRPALQQSVAAFANIHWLGERQDVPELLPGFDVFALTSRWEGEPIALLEAMGSGLACVATQTAGAREVIEPGQNGLLIDIGDTEGVANALRSLHAEPRRRKMLGNHAAQSVKARTYAQQAQQISALYEQIIVDKRISLPV